MAVATSGQQRRAGPAGAADRSSTNLDFSEQERQLERDRAMISTYREAWQQKKGVGHAVVCHVRDALWWMEHICGINMLDYEEKVVVVCVFMAVIALVMLGAYKQGTQLARGLQQLAAGTFSSG